MLTPSAPSGHAILTRHPKAGRNAWTRRALGGGIRTHARESSAETVWVKTTANREKFIFRSDSVSSSGATRARGFHTVVVKCEDDRGALSALATASFTSTTITPVVQILVPAPHTL